MKHLKRIERSVHMGDAGKRSAQTSGRLWGGPRKAPEA